MTVAQMLSHLFNLQAQTSFWTSGAAARDFWTLFGLLAAGTVAYFAARTAHRRPERQAHHFGHTSGR